MKARFLFTPELWQQPLSVCELPSAVLHFPSLHSAHSSSSSSPSVPQSERGENKPHVSGKNLERAASQTKVPRALLPLPPASLSSTLSLGTGLGGFCWMAAVCWRRTGAGRYGQGSGVMSSSEGSLGGATGVLH